MGFPFLKAGAIGWLTMFVLSTIGIVEIVASLLGKPILLPLMSGFVRPVSSDPLNIIISILAITLISISLLKLSKFTGGTTTAAAIFGFITIILMGIVVVDSLTPKPYYTTTLSGLGAGLGFGFAVVLPMIISLFLMFLLIGIALVSDKAKQTIKTPLRLAAGIMFIIYSVLILPIFTLPITLDLLPALFQEVLFIVSAIVFWRMK